MSRSGTGAVRAIRILLLVLLVGGVAAVTALYVLGRVGRQAPLRLGENDEPERGEEGADGYAVEGGSIRYTATQGDRVLFEIQGSTYRAGRDGAVLLENVAIEMARDEGGYRLEGAAASYDPTTHEARLEGDALVRGPNQLVLRTDWLELRDGGRVVVASKGSEFELGERFVGSARHLRLDLEQDQILLSGGVRLMTREGAPTPLRLRARAISYDRRARKVRARGDVRLARPDARLESRRLAIDLDADTDDPRVVRAFGNVVGWWQMAPPPGTSEAPQVTAARAAEVEDATDGDEELLSVEESAPELRRYDLRGMKLVLLLGGETQQPERVDLEGFRRVPAVLEAIDARGARRSLTGVDVAAGFDDGLVSWARSRGGIRLLEVDPAGRELRKASAQRAEALFDDVGTLVRIELDEEVLLEEEGVQARADHATIDDRAGRTDLRSETWVEVVSEQGAMQAPTVTYTHETGLMTAEGGVSATMAAGEGTAVGPLGQAGSDEPVRVEAAEALLRQEDGDFVFTGDARAWQEQSRITARQIRGNQRTETLTASGSVATHWQSATAGTVAETPADQPVDIAADHFSYGGGDDGVLVYEGGVVVRQAGRRLLCKHLTVTLEADREVERMDCREDAVLEDPAFGRKVSGERALYFPQLGEVVVTPPLTLEEPNRTIESPQRLWYRLEDGRFELGPQAPDPEDPG
ncbi:MAG TPA: hypothetical protein VMT85_20185 [Thermoanaerobaculia bacterium]|nr:hypothetical protein [Thermoanaerobaculia bacterium]